MKLKIIIATLFLAFLSSCNVNNTSDIVISNQDLIGTWDLTNVTMDDAVLNVTSPIVTTLTGSGFGKNLNATLTFSENPNQATVAGTFVFQLTYKDLTAVEYTEDITLNSIFFNDTFGFLTSSWELNDNILSLNEGGEQLEINIISFVNNVITIETDVNKTATLDGVTSTVTGKALISLQKR